MITIIHTYRKTNVFREDMFLNVRLWKRVNDLLIEYNIYPPIKCGIYPEIIPGDAEIKMLKGNLSSFDPYAVHRTNGGWKRYLQQTLKVSFSINLLHNA